ncbi:MAG: YggT family protein [Candidatus Paracaedibacteraceae bacterium]|nr:YggT family protein [Candidatus Paracaedibacteraceae bacterium]
MILLIPLLSVVDSILDLARYLLIAYVILGWLEAFGIVNRYNKVVFEIHNFLFRVLEPLLNPIRRLLPDLGGIDLSAIILFLAISFLKGVIYQFSMQHIAG